MKNNVLVAFCAAVALLAAGCISTVNGSRTMGVPFTKDKKESRYERPLDEVFNAAKYVVSNMGLLTKESVISGGSNVVKVVEGKINQRNVWVRVEPVDPKVTDVTVQARTAGGGSDVDLAAEIDKQIALKLVK
jgi:Protein of unknown function (DUF3568)